MRWYLGTHVPVLVIVFAALLVPAISGFANAIPLPTDRQWLSVGGTYCHNPTLNGTRTCTNGGTASGFIDPLTTFTHPDWAAQGVFLQGGGSISANALRVFVASNNGFSRATAVMEDTYMLSVAPGGSTDPVQIEVRFSAEGSMDILVPHSLGYAAGQGTASISIGRAMDASGQNVFPTLVQAGYNTPFVNNSSGGAQTHYEFDILATHMLTVTPGVAFDLAFRLDLAGTLGFRGDALNTALVDFVLPDGYTLTSDMGWTSPTAVVVAAPPSLMLFGFALAALSAAARRRSPID